MKTPTVQAYPDGIVRIYATENTAAAGGKPHETLMLRETLPFAQKTVGMHRYYKGIQVDYRIDNLLRTPRRANVSTDDIAITHDGTRYRIRQVQYPEDSTPPCMDLSLERTGTTDDA